jgi:hypothetical protein
LINLRICGIDPDYALEPPISEDNLFDITRAFSTQPYKKERESVARSCEQGALDEQREPAGAAEM